MWGGRFFMGKRLLLGCLLVLLFCLAGLGRFIVATRAELLSFEDGLLPRSLAVRKPQYLDRNGIILSVTFENSLNIHDWLPLHEIPALLQAAFLASEDRRFSTHHGVDWLARIHALGQNMLALRGVRGASTISEQVVRILHPRPRTLWSRWLEGIEAARLEKQFTKLEILEFYLNQVPYSHQRRGVLQAARLYFDRDLSTLTTTELLILAVLVRSPGRLGRQEGAEELARALDRLSKYLASCGTLPAQTHVALQATSLLPKKLHLPVEAGHFIRQLAGHQAREPGTSGNQASKKTHGPARILTTLDSVLQASLQQLFDQHLLDLQSLDVHNGAVLVVNHQTDEILAWTNSNGGRKQSTGSWIDAVTSPRQPGSTLKPFLYAQALDKGWTAATIIDDSPMARQVGDGMHPFHNYSRQYYGPLRLREALGNSLNIPAIRTIQFVGVGDFLDCLHSLGVSSLHRNSGHYGEGLALGNGEVSLFDLVQGYAVLARGGVMHPLRFTLGGRNYGPPHRQIFSPEAASLIADILSDPQARRREFGHSGSLGFPIQTAIKTGTSNDHRDTWAIGFNHRYVVGIWMGNLDGHSTKGLTGSTGPGAILRSFFSEVNNIEDTRPLHQSPRLAVTRICSLTGLLAGPSCTMLAEKFLPGTLPQRICEHQAMSAAGLSDGKTPPAQSLPAHIIQPSPNLQMAMDPHIPDSVEAYPMKISPGHSAKRIEWLVDGAPAGITGENQDHFMWPLSRGNHLLLARLWYQDGPHDTAEVPFVVK